MSGEFDLLMWPLTCCCHANRLGCERAVLPERSGPGPGSSGSGGSDSRLWQVAGPFPAARSHLEHGKHRRPPAAEKTDTSVHSPTTSQPSYCQRHGEHTAMLSLTHLCESLSSGRDSEHIESVWEGQRGRGVAVWLRPQEAGTDDWQHLQHTLENERDFGCFTTSNHILYLYHLLALDIIYLLLKATGCGKQLSNQHCILYRQTPVVFSLYKTN